MQDVNEDRELTAFLLGSLDEQSRERILDRLCADEEFFTHVAAFEDELILRWYRGQLSPPERAQFVHAYSAPSRRARVDELLMLVKAADAWNTRSGALGMVQRVVDWMREAWMVPRLAYVGALVVALVYAVYLINSGQFERERPLTMSFTLSAIGVKSGTASEKGYDLIELLPGTATLELSVNVQGGLAEGELKGEIVARDRPAVIQLDPPRIYPVQTASRLTFTTSASDLPDGDYVLTVSRHVTGTSMNVATQSFRISRLSSPRSR